MNSLPAPTAERATNNSTNEPPARRNVGMLQSGGAGTPALYLTSGDYLRAICEREDAKKMEEEEKATRLEKREARKKRRPEEAAQKKSNGEPKNLRSN